MVYQLPKKSNLGISLKIWVPKWLKKSLEKFNAAGDGTTTATVLVQAVVKQGAKAVASGMNPMDLKRN